MLGEREGGTSAGGAGGVLVRVGGAPVGNRSAAGADGALTVLGAASGTRGAAAAGKAPPLDVLGMASGTRGAEAAGKAPPLDVLGMAAGKAPPLEVRGGAGIDGPVEVRGADSEGRGGAPELAFPGLQSESGSCAAGPATEGAGPRIAGDAPDAPGTVPEVRGAAEAGTDEPLTVRGASGARGGDETVGGAPGRLASGIRGVCPAGAEAARAPLTPGLAGGGRVPGCAAGRAGPLATVGGVAGALVVRGGGRPPPVAGTPGDEPVRGAVGGAIGFGARGQEGIVPVGMRSGFRGTDPGDPLEAGAPACVPGPAVVGGGRWIGVPAVVTGRGPGKGVSTGGLDSNAGPGRGSGVSIGIGSIGPEAVGGSSRKGSGVSRGGPGGGCLRSSAISRLRIGGAGRSGSLPGSQAVQSPCGGNSAPHLRHLDTAA